MSLTGAAAAGTGGGVESSGGESMEDGRAASTPFDHLLLAFRGPVRA